MQKVGYGVGMISALSLSLIQLVEFRFVDNIDLFCTGKTATTLGETLSPDFQAALHRWTGDLNATIKTHTPQYVINLTMMNNYY